MADTIVDLSGLDVLDDAADALAAAVAKGVAAAGALVLADAKRRAPKRTGRLRDHLTMSTTADKTSATAVVEVADSQSGGAMSFEAWGVEFGHYTRSGRRHRFVAAEPFIRPAFHANEARASAVIADAVAEALNKD